MKHILFLLALVLIVLSSCKTVSTDFAPGTPAEGYFQRAQSANDVSDYDTALVIYQKFLDSGLGDRSYNLSARYEIALIHYKVGKKPLAKQEFLGILDEFADSTRSATLPLWIKILSEKKLAEMPNVKTQKELDDEAKKLAEEKAAKASAEAAAKNAPTNGAKAAAQ